MPDMAVKLYELDEDRQLVTGQKCRGITIRKPIGPEKHLLIQWVSKNFGSAWAAETDTAFGNTPRSCFVAVKQPAIVGFACYDATALGFFGPVGVDTAYRRQGIGTTLLISCLLDMKLKGYGYAIIGAVKETGFYEKAVGALEIPGSEPGFYRTWVRKVESPS